MNAPAEAAVKRAVGAARRVFSERPEPPDHNDDEVHRRVDQRAQKAAKALAMPPRRPSEGIDAADLLNADLADPAYLVRPWVAEGVTLVCGRPKIGKTTLLRQVAVAVNTGGSVFGATANQVATLFLSLEEGKRLFRKKLRASCIEVEDVRGIRLEFEWERGALGVSRLREWLKALTTAGSALIIIDSLTRFREPPSQRGNAFVEDYNAVMLLAELCKEFPGLAILVLHHTTKATPDDPVAAISGTYGLTAAAENYLILLKQGERFRLHTGGRLWEGDASDFELRRQDGGWSLAGEWDSSAPQGLTPKQQTVVNALSGGAKSGKTLAQATGQSASALSHLMGSLQDRGLVSRVANGWELVR